MSTEKLRMVITGDDEDAKRVLVTYPRLYTLPEFLAKYGEDSVTIMLQDRESHLYHLKADELLKELGSDPDAEKNVQTAIDAWKPNDDRPPTDLETMANEFLDLSPQAQARLRKHIEDGINAKTLVDAKSQGDVATAKLKEMNEKFAPPDDVGPPMIEGQKEPTLDSFEDTGRESDEAIQEAQETREKGYQPTVDAETAKAIQQNPPSGGSSVTPPPTDSSTQEKSVADALVESQLFDHVKDVEASKEDYIAPVEQEEGGTEGVVIEPEAQTQTPEG